MAVATRDLARITVDTPMRRLDVAVPADVPVADLLLAFLRAGGEGLAEGGNAWVVRRVDGTVLSTSETLKDQGVRDGAILHLVTAEASWPEPEYDDIGDAIAATRTIDRSWSPAATQWAGGIGGAIALLVALAAILRDEPHRQAAAVAGAIAVVMLAVGASLTRARGDAWSGTLVASIALPYAFVAGLLASGRPPTAQDVLAGCVAAAIVGGIALAAVGRAGEPIISGTVAALVLAAGAGLDRIMSPSDAAALVLGAVLLLAGLIPAAALRIGGVARWHADGGPAALADAVARTDSVVIGLLGAVGIVALVDGLVLVRTGDGWCRALVVVGAVVLGLRTRAYGSIRHRVVGLIAAALLAGCAGVWALTSGAAPTLVIGGAALVGLIAILAGTGAITSPAFARFGDLVEALAILAVAPLVCGALHLYAQAHGLH